MTTCSHCGATVEENAAFCSSCGSQIGGADYQASNAWQRQYQEPYGKTANSTGILIWSIFSILCCCLPLGIVSLIYVTNAKNCMTEQEYKEKIKVAMICNIIALVSGILVNILYIVAYLVYGFAGQMSLAG